MNRITLVALALAPLVWSSPAHAHRVMVDGVASDWFSRAPNAGNLGIVARSSMSTGELIWRDVDADTRTDLSMPETAADLTSFAVTADATNVYFLIQLGISTGPVISVPQVQIAIDTDRSAGSGNDFFAGLADTRASNTARWEFLVQTQGLSSARILDTTYTSVGAAGFAIGGTLTGTTIEISVPLATIGGPGRSIDVLRFTVATFRESLSGDTIDIGGASVPNALDVISDYGDPRTTMFPNTFAEFTAVGDQTIDHALDAWLERTTREVYAPLAVARFVSNAGTGATEWIEIRNQTALPYVDRACVGDEETPDGASESMQCSGITIAAGASIVIANNGATYQTRYGVLPDFEQVAMSAAPEFVGASNWSTGTAFALANGADEILVLDSNRTIVDLVTYGTAAYAGITALTPAPGANAIARRQPVTSDTDDCLVDFQIVPDCGPAVACGTCRTCARFACDATPGVACDDGDACTTGTTCTAAAACSGGSATTCNDGNGCTVDTCAAATGCVFTPSPGALCDDGQSCTTADVCVGMVCTGTVSCDDMNPCTADACGPTGACINTPTPGIACNDGNACTSTDVCSVTGTCGGTTITCPSDGNVCTTEACSPATGCASTNNTLPCDDGAFCTVGDVCAAGACGGTPRVCDDSNTCTTDSCAGAACVFTPVSAGTMCDDGNGCTVTDVCTAGVCGGSPRSCDDMNACTTDGCAAGACTNVPVANGTGCNDGDACTMSDVCAAGVCMGSGMCDAGVDAGTDAGSDAGPADAGTDAGDIDAGDIDGGGADAGGVDAPGTDVGMPADGGPLDGGGDASGTDGGPRDGGPGRDGGGTADAGSPGVSGGCGCRTGTRPDTGITMLALAALALIARRRR